MIASIRGTRARDINIPKKVVDPELNPVYIQ